MKIMASRLLAPFLTMLLAMLLVAPASAQYSYEQQLQWFLEKYSAAQKANDTLKMHDMINEVNQVALYEATQLAVRMIMQMRCQMSSDGPFLATAYSLADEYARGYSSPAIRSNVHSILSLPANRCGEYLETRKWYDDSRIALNSGKYLEADSLLRKSIVGAKKLGDKEIELLSLNERFSVLSKLNPEEPATREALEIITRAADLVDRVAYPQASYAVFGNAGKAQREVGNYALSEKYYERCLHSAKRDSLGKGALAIALLGLVETAIAAREKEKALNYWQDIVKIKELNADEEFFIFKSACKLAGIAGEQGDKQLVNEFLEPVKSITQRKGSLTERASIMAFIATPYQAADMADSAKKYFTEALVLARETENPDAIAVVCLGLAYAENSLNQSVEALQTLREGYTCIKDAKASFTKMQIMQQIAEAYLNNGDIEQCELFLSDAFNQAVSENSHPDAANIALYIAEISLLMDKQEQADTFLKRVLDGELPCDLRGKAKAHGLRGDLRKKQNDFRAALQDYTAALELQRKLGIAQHITVTLFKMAEAYVETNEYVEAAKCLNEMEKTFPNGNAELAESIKKVVRSNILDKQGKPVEAVNEFAAIYDQEMKRAYGELLSDNKHLNLAQSLFRANCQSFGDILLRAAQKSGDPTYARRAFIVSEEGKSINFQKIMTRYLSSRSSSIPKEIREQIDRYNTLFLKKHAIEQEHRSLQSAFVLSLQLEIAQIDSQLLDLSQKILKKLPQLYHEELALSSIPTAQALLDKNEALLSYRVGYNQLIIFVLTCDKFGWETIPISRKDLREQVLSVLEGVRQVESFNDLCRFEPAKAEALYRILFQPINKYLQSIAKIIVIPDDALYTFPLEMLVTSIPEKSDSFDKSKSPFLSEYAGVRYLVDEAYTISYIPSLAAFLAFRTQPVSTKWDKSFIAFADPDFEQLNEGLRTIRYTVKSDAPDSSGKPRLIVYKKRPQDIVFNRLEDTRTEAMEVAQITKAQAEDLYLGNRAAEILVNKAPLSSTRFLLFATHGIMPTEDNGIQEPCLALTRYENSIDKGPDDGLLTASEVMELHLSAELVVLSACETAGDTSSSIQGEGFLGLTRAFMFAGAQNLIVSHWSVGSQSTQHLISTLFRNRMDKQESNVMALRNAKQWLRLQTASYPDHPSGKISYAHPFFWAPFVLVGAH